MAFDIDLSISSQENENLIISSDKTITLSFEEQDSVKLITDGEEKCSFSIESNQEDIDIEFDFTDFYTGAYEVTSSIEEQTMLTANKKMLGNVNIKPIPVSRVSAPGNKGYVVTIG